MTPAEAAPTRGGPWAGSPAHPGAAGFPASSSPRGCLKDGGGRGGVGVAADGRTCSGHGPTRCTVPVGPRPASRAACAAAAGHDGAPPAVVAAEVTASPDAAWCASRRGMWRWTWAIGACRSGSCSATTRPSSPLLRRRLRERGWADPLHADPGAEGQPRRRAVGADRAGGMSGLDAGARAVSFAVAAARLCPPLPPAATPPRPGAGRSRA
jgi:hypothetical protein